MQKSPGDMEIVPNQLEWNQPFNRMLQKKRWIGLTEAHLQRGTDGHIPLTISVLWQI